MLQQNGHCLFFNPADSISVAVDSVEYCRFNASNGRTVNGLKPTGANAWRQYGDPMAPFDRPFYVALGVGLAGFNDFADSPHQRYRTAKPWRNDDVNAKRAFWEAVSGQPQWPGDTAKLLVDYVRVYAL